MFFHLSESVIGPPVLASDSPCKIVGIDREMPQIVVEDTTLYRHLHKLVGLKSGEELENLLEMLWQTRKTGLSAPQKYSLQSLLGLPNLTDLDPVLACLRSLLIKCLHESFDGDYVLKLFPPDLTLEMQSMLLVTLQKHQNQWKEELSQEQHLFGKTRFSNLLNDGLPTPLLSFSAHEVSGSLLSRQFTITQFSNHNLGGHTSMAAGRNMLRFPTLTLQNDVVPTDILGTLPQLKSVTWAVENKTADPESRVAVITLELQDYNKFPSTEMEVKFQLTTDTLDAVLRSMVYINEQLSRFAGPSSVPLQKKQRL